MTNKKDEALKTKTAAPAPERKAARPVKTAAETKASVAKVTEAVAPEVKTEEPKAEAQKETKTEKPAVEAKKPLEKTAEKKTAAPKKEADEKKTESKKDAETKPVAKKEVNSSVFIEYAGRKIAVSDVLEAAKNAYAEKHKDVVFETVEIYVKPEEGVAYYVVNGDNGDGSPEFKVVL